jgi:hypothetical protein
LLPALTTRVLGGEGDVAVVDELPELAAGEPERGTADADQVLFGQHLLGDPLPVDERPVVAAEVDDLVLAGG